MQVVDKVSMFMVAVDDMPKAKEFYADKLGLAVKTDYRQDDHNWWVSLTLPGDSPTITLTTYFGDLKPGAMQFYMVSSDVQAAHKELAEKGVKVSPVKDDLYGPGSGVKWFDFADPDGNHLYIAAS